MTTLRLSHNLTLELADAHGLRWAQRMVTEHHYLRKPVDPRCRPIAYLVHHQASWGADAALRPARFLFLAAPDAAEMTPAGPRVSWEGTLWLWRSWYKALAARGLPLAIVLQDGATVESVPWDQVDAVFVGGSDRWKDGPEPVTLLDEAGRRGLWRHVGRVNTQRRERHVWPRCDSFDGSGYSRWPDTLIPPCLARLTRHQFHRQHQITLTLDLPAA